MHFLQSCITVAPQYNSCVRLSDAIYAYSTHLHNNWKQCSITVVAITNFSLCLSLSLPLFNSQSLHGWTAATADTSQQQKRRLSGKWHLCNSACYDTQTYSLFLALTTCFRWKSFHVGMPRRVPEIANSPIESKRKQSALFSPINFSTQFS